jgi:hypothetical protein
MQYQPAFNIWEIPHALMRHIQPGQHVYAGTTDNKGVFLGVKKRSGIVVVAWQGNIKNHGNRADYLQTLRNYAKG